MSAGRPVMRYLRCQLAVRLNARDARAASVLAGAAMRTGQTVVAREQYERLIALGYLVASAHFNLDLLAERRGDRPAAVPHFAAALAADAAFKPAREALARVK